MAKGVVYSLLATALIVLMVYSPSKQRLHNLHGLNRRLGYTGHVPIFDPLVAMMERYAEEKGLGDQNHPIDLEHDSVIANGVEEAHEYLSEEGKLNITLRLVSLFPLLDHAPKDGFITYNELKHWITAQAKERMDYRTHKELAAHDKDGDGAISFKEYLPQFSIEDIGIHLTILRIPLSFVFHFDTDMSFTWFAEWKCFNFPTEKERKLKRAVGFQFPPFRTSFVFTSPLIREPISFPCYQMK